MRVCRQAAEEAWERRRLPGDWGFEEQSDGVSEEEQGVRGKRLMPKRARPVVGPGAAIWLQWKIPARGKNSIQQIFMTPTQCKEGQAESPGMALFWHHSCCCQWDVRGHQSRRRSLRSCKNQVGS